MDITTFSNLKEAIDGAEALATKYPDERPNEVLIFANGTAAVVVDKEVRPDLSNSWLTLFAEFLESKGEDPTRYVYRLPDGAQRAVIQRCSDKLYIIGGFIDLFSYCTVSYDNIPKIALYHWIKSAGHIYPPPSVFGFTAKILSS